MIVKNNVFTNWHMRNEKECVLDLEEEEVEPNNDILNFGEQQRNLQKDDIKK